MTTFSWYKTYLDVIDWILEAGERIRIGMQQPLDVQEKSGRGDFVTNMDKATEQFLTEKIFANYSTHRIFGEESQSDGKDTVFKNLDGPVWIIDPIDGTLNFVKQQRDFGIMLAFFIDGKPILGCVYDVIRRELYSAIHQEGAFLNGRRLAKVSSASLADSIILVEMGQIRRQEKQTLAAIEQALAARTVGASAMVTSILARQAATAFIGRNQMPWDAAAPMVILREIGYHVTLCDGSAPTLLRGEPFLMAAPGVYETLLSLYQN